MDWMNKTSSDEYASDTGCSLSSKPSLSIISVKARRIFDSRGNSTIEVDLETTSGSTHASVPSELVNEADVKIDVNNINSKLANELIIEGFKETQQADIDEFLRKQTGYSTGALLAISMAVAKAGAEKERKLLYEYLSEMKTIHNESQIPVPVFNLINGGLGIENNLNIKQFMIYPTNAKSFAEAMEIGGNVYRELKNGM